MVPTIDRHDDNREEEEDDAEQGNHSHAIQLQQQQATGGTAPQPEVAAGPPATPTRYISSLISRSSTLLISLKQQYYSSSANSRSLSSSNSATMHTTSSMESSSSSLGAAGDDSAATRQQTPATTETNCTLPGPSRQQQQQHPATTPSSGAINSSVSGGDLSGCCPAPSKKPPIPPRPPASPAHHHLASSSKQRSLDVTNLQLLKENKLATNRLLNSGSGNLSATTTAASSGSTRRHALQEQSLERDAALSLKVRPSDKHKRTSSIKSALKHAHLGSLRSAGNSSFSHQPHQHHDGRAGKDKASSSSGAHASGGGGKGLVKSMPYELFEPPVTQRTFQRSRRRGAMSQDPKRQMSADTIGLRQLTDEYLQNAGLKPISSSGQCSLVALTNLTSISGPASSGGAHPASGNSGSTTPATVGAHLRHQESCAASTSAVAGTSCGGDRPAPGSGSGGSDCGSASQQQQQYQNIEAQLYQASRQLTARGDSQDSFSSVTILPGNLPWQSDVSIQCELLRPPLGMADDEQPYETTGDILQTIARPFRPNPHLSSSRDQQQQQQAASFDSLGGAATLKRKLTAISHHHLSPIVAAQNVCGPGGANLNVVVGNLKKSLSNTLDVGLHLQAATTPYLCSQDSLPAYSSLKNEPDSPSDGETIDQRQQLQLQRLGSRDSSQEAAVASASEGDSAGNNNNNSSSLIGQITSKITRQSSKKFSASKKGLQRALSFDYRNHKTASAASTKPLDASTETGSRQSANSGKGHLLSAASKLAAHNRSSLGLNHQAGGGGGGGAPGGSESLLMSPRPYLPQSASQVDFQVPLLPFHKMQEAIVSQRLLDSSGRSSQQQQQQPPDKQTDLAKTERQPDADELLCAQQPPPTAGSLPVEPQQVHQSTRKETAAQRTSLPRLVLDIPTIATHQDDCSSSAAEPSKISRTRRHRRAKRNSNNSVISSEDGQEGAGEIYGDQEDSESDDGGEDACANEQDDSSRSTVIVCLPSPNISMEPRFGQLSNPSPGAAFDMLNQMQQNRNSDQNEDQQQPANFLSAQDIFSQSKNLIKRPSTMMTASSADDALHQVAQAFNRNQQQQQDSAALRNRRRAIVPPKLATDASSSDAEGATEGQLVDLECGDEDQDGQNPQEKRDQEQEQEEETMRALRRKRSGGGGCTYDRKSSAAGGKQQASEKRYSGSQTNIPTFRIDQDTRQQDGEDDEDAVSETVSSCLPADTTRPLSGTPRPDSQMTNVESIVSSGSSLSISNKRGDLTVTSPGGLTVTFGSLKNRRRSSIAIIPQMQICPGDLLVYSKQMIDRMNQNEQQESEPPSFLIEDGKKGKNNIWSSLKLCAQFDNRNQKARNELLCSLEDVLASLQPSTFADEQLSRYKGMNWNDFLIETGSRRSVSTEALDNLDDYEENNTQTDSKKRSTTIQEDLSQLQTLSLNCLGSGGSHQDLARPNNLAADRKETVKVTLSSGPGQLQQQAPSPGVNTGGHRSRDTTVKSTITSRFKEKPKLKRGQTVDSVFRIPLIPSSPLKHAQLHQQTPTAHLDHDNDLLIIEDDERSSPSATSGGAGSREPSLTRGRASSTRSRRDSSRVSNRSKQNGADSGSQQQLQEDDIGQFESPARQNPLAAPAGMQAARHGAMMRQSSLSTLSSTITRTEQKRQRALWDLFQSECTFFFDHLMTLKNVYMEPLKKIQVEGFAMFADPDVLFGNLDELCCGVYDFCKEFLFIIMRTLKTRPEELNATDVLIKLYKKNPKIDHLRGVYHRYTLNYINAITYLDSLRNQVEFTEFENWSSRDARCKKLQLTDLLVAPVQHIMRVPIILKDIESHTETPKDRDEIRAILAVEEASLRELDDKMRWLKNFERLLEIQKNIVWPTVYDMAESKLIPECLREILTKQPIERLIVSPWRQIVHEGTLSNLDAGKPSDMHVILFDDMLLLTRRKKALTKKASTICKTNSGSSSMRDDGSFKYNVYKQPLSLDRFTVHDIDPLDAQYKAMSIKNVFVLVVMNRFQQFTNVHNFAAPNDDIKQTWMFKMRKTQERWQRNQLNTPNDQQQHNKQPDPQQTTTAASNSNSNNNHNHHQRATKMKSTKSAAAGQSSGQHSS